MTNPSPTTSEVPPQGETSNKKEAALSARNHYGFGIGTFGRDASYTLISMYLIYYLTEAIKVSTQVLAVITVIMVCARIFDAVSDPFVGVLIDNTRTKWGKFKPWIIAGALVSSVLMIMLFADFSLSDGTYIVYFLIIYVLWGISFTANDVSYWSLLPALSQSQHQREKIGSFARICANLGAFSMVVGIVPITNAIGDATGSLAKGYFVLSIATAVVLILFQAITVFSVKEDRSIPWTHERTKFRDLATIIFRNDQLVTVAATMTLFSVAYAATTSLGIYFFKYVYGDENMYSVFALILGISQIGALIAYPAIAKRIGRRNSFTLAWGLAVFGYTLFFFAPTSNMVFIGVAGLTMFIGQAFIQILNLMFISDSVEYGQWKLGRRNESVTLSVQPFINKLGGALGAGVVGATVILSGIQHLPNGEVLTGDNLIIFKSAMLLFPLALISLSYFVYRRFYRIDATFYEQIVTELHARAEEAQAIRIAESNITKQ